MPLPQSGKSTDNSLPPQRIDSGRGGARPTGDPLPSSRGNSQQRSGSPSSMRTAGISYSSSAPILSQSQADPSQPPQPLLQPRPKSASPARTTPGSTQRSTDILASRSRSGSPPVHSSTNFQSQPTRNLGQRIIDPAEPQSRSALPLRTTGVSQSTAVHSLPPLLTRGLQSTSRSRSSSQATDDSQSPSANHSSPNSSVQSESPSRRSPSSGPRAPPKIPPLLTQQPASTMQSQPVSDDISPRLEAKFKALADLRPNLKGKVLAALWNDLYYMLTAASR